MVLLSRRLRLVLSALAVALAVYGAYAAFVSYAPGDRLRVEILAGVAEDGSMFFRCEPARSTAGACEDAGGHARILASKRDRVTVTVRTDDGRRHSHDFRLMGAPYLVPPAGIEMELKAPSETKSFTAYATGEFRFICELPGHEASGMWGTLSVRG